jgi:dihydroorotate dehydrogenase (fumarate)
MTNLTTTYMGLTLRSPVVLAASTLSEHLVRVRQAESAGAGAVVLRSLFEEQIAANPQEMRALLEEASPVKKLWASPGAQTISPGPEAYVEWARRVREILSIPVIASLNAATPGAWTDFAQRLEDAGMSALELNIYRIPSNPGEPSAMIEENTVEIVRSVCQKVSIPVAVKLSPFYTSLGGMAKAIGEAGAESLVLFNRFLQPDIDSDAEEIVSELEFSTPAEIKLPLRWTALLYGKIGMDIALTTGVHAGRDVVKALLAGASIVQVASVLYRRGIDEIRTLNAGLTAWMEAKGYTTLDEFRGKLSQLRHPGAHELERAHYVKLLLAQT